MGMFQKIKAYLNEDDAEYDALIEEQERMREERRKRRNQSRAERNKEKAKRAAEKAVLIFTTVAVKTFNLLRRIYDIYCKIHWQFLDSLNINEIIRHEFVLLLHILHVIFRID